MLDETLELFEKILLYIGVYGGGLYYAGHVYVAWIFPLLK